MTASACWQRASLYEFDDVFTAPLHGFKHALDYWMRASMPHLHRISVPTLIVHARNDPLCPRTACRSATMSAPASRCGSLHAAGMWALRMAAGRVMRSLPDAVGAWFNECTHG